MTLSRSGDQILRREVAVEVHVIAREAVHALAAAFESKQRGAFQMILRAAQFFGAERFIAQAAEFIEHGTNQLRSSIERSAGINGKRAGIAIGIQFAENGVGEALALANILKEARRHATAENVVKHGDGEAAAIGHGQRGDAHADVDLLELMLGAQGDVRCGLRCELRPRRRRQRRRLRETFRDKIQQLRVGEMARGGDDHIDSARIDG